MEKLGFAFAMLQPWAFVEDQQSPPLVLIKMPLAATEIWAERFQFQFRR